MTRPFWFLTTVLIRLQMLTRQMLGYLSTIPWINSLYYKCALNLNSVLCISSTQFSWLHLKTMVICSIFIISLVKTSKSKLIDNWQLAPNSIFSKRGSEKHKWPLHVVSVHKSTFTFKLKCLKQVFHKKHGTPLFRWKVTGNLQNVLTMKDSTSTYFKIPTFAIFHTLFSMASNYIQVWREQWTYVMHNYFAQTRKLACPNTDKTTAIRGWELGSPPSLLLWATSCQSAECCRLPLAWCLQALHCCCCSSWHYCFPASYFHY